MVARLGRVQGVLLALTACSPSAGSEEAAGDSGGVELPPTTSADATTLGADDTDSTGADEDPDPSAFSCESDADCGELRCLGGRCHGCVTWQDCPEGLICSAEYCKPPEDAPDCLGADAPVCGDGIIGALEECEGTASCDACEDGSDPEVWWAFDAPYYDRAKVTADGAVYVLENGDLNRIDSDGNAEWMRELELDGGLAVDAEGNVFVATAVQHPVSLASSPYIASWDPQGQPRWEAENEAGRYWAVAADAERVVAVGWTTQANTPQTRGLVAQYDADGTLAYSNKHVDLRSISYVALAGSATVVVAATLDWSEPARLIRLDERGVAEWALDVRAEEGGWIQRLTGLAHDGEGGSWIWGEREEGPWAVRHDASGNVVDRLECFAGTAGWLTHLAVAPDGQLALGILVTGGPIPFWGHVPWVARVSDGEIVQGWRLGDEDTNRRMFALDWLPNGRIAAGISELDPDGSRMVVLE